MANVFSKSSFAAYCGDKGVGGGYMGVVYMTFLKCDISRYFMHHMISGWDYRTIVSFYIF